MTEVSVTESLQGLALPLFTADYLIRNDKGQVIERRFFISIDLAENPRLDPSGLVGVLYQEFDGTGLLISRRLDVTHPDPRIAPRVRAVLAAERNRARFQQDGENVIVGSNIPV